MALSVLSAVLRVGCAAISVKILVVLFSHIPVLSSFSIEAAISFIDLSYGLENR
ncbi:hypothetical protein [Wolbachia endosymbiont of Oedothorax gibbosus]|uniref:hypothetical protein n=1 Tax=Wolbachia endosymbiont of Oedothorax gibbosus TaxID=931100 RepID=UPI0020242199|nr:hypothetical protein [Wolbachia endosymbiont of Oedothorax gibbosus]